MKREEQIGADVFVVGHGIGKTVGVKGDNIYVELEDGSEVVSHLVYPLEDIKSWRLYTKFEALPEESYRSLKDFGVWALDKGFEGDKDGIR